MTSRRLFDCIAAVSIPVVTGWRERYFGEPDILGKVFSGWGWARADSAHTHLPFPWKVPYHKFVIPIGEVEWNADPRGSFLRAIEPYRNEAKLQELRGYVFDAAEELMYGYGS